MTFIQTVLLGTIAGLTIFLGLPLGRLSSMPEKTRTFLSMISAGILLFLFFDIFKQLSEPIESALSRKSYGEMAVLLAILIAGFGLGLLGLILFEQRFMRFKPGSAGGLSAGRLALMIAAGIGLHNFSEGLAIGQSAGSGQIGFATLLLIGFGLHNATEGFGIVGPLVGKDRPSWRFLALLGLIGGGPTFFGTLLGWYLVSPAMSVLFLALAAGALVYILGELLHINRRPTLKYQAGWGLFAGLVFAYLTDLLLKVGGA